MRPGRSHRLPQTRHTEDREPGVPSTGCPLGTGVGWNPVEYEAMGADFLTRGRRIEEQVLILRALCARQVIDAEGEFDRVVGVGLEPRPPQQPIPCVDGRVERHRVGPHRPDGRRLVPRPRMGTRRPQEVRSDRHRR
ncbi:LLM class flavin-dependent oxidoreductase [Streptomyces sp. NPDC001933]|uniref:LLM class flavin-dependent oxidoreductase n=1 Tax=Streptomyces sp. NPDC001933 TaxID=3364626 RepID=UPI0036A9AE4C